MSATNRLTLSWVTLVVEFKGRQSDNRPSQVAQWAKNLPAMQETQEMRVWSLGWEDPLEKGMVTHSDIFCQEIPMDRGAQQPIVPRVAKSQTQLKRLSMQSDNRFFRITKLLDFGK